MILAPRSWPSRPGLATRIRSVRAGGTPSHPRGVAIDAELLAIDVADLAERDAILHGGDERRHQVLTVATGAADRVEARARPCLIARRLERAYARRLPLLERGIDAQQVDRRLVAHLILVDADHHLLAAIELALEMIRRLGDLLLWEAELDRADDPAHRVDLPDVLFGFALDARRQRLDGVAAAERIGGVRDAALLGDDLLRPQRHHDRLLARQRQGLVHRVGVQRLHAAEDAGERLDRDPDDVVHR